MRLAGGWLWLLPILALAGQARAEALPAAYAHLRAEDVAAAAATLQDALERALSYQSGRWRNDGNGASGVVTPLRTFRVADGRYCRDFVEIVVANGRPPASRKSTACRRPDGQWEPMLP